MKDNTLSRYARLDIKLLNKNSMNFKIMSRGFSPLSRQETLFLHSLSVNYNNITGQIFDWESIDYWTFVSIMKKLGNKNTIKSFKNKLKLGNNFIDSILY